MRAPTIEDLPWPRLLFIQQVADAVIVFWQQWNLSARIAIRDAIFDRV